MRRKSKRKWIISILIILAVAGFGVLKLNHRGDAKPKVEFSVLDVEIGEIKAEITTTGSVEPQNRLEVKPPISGRIDEMLVKEGDKVKEGQVIAWISSTERAALMDAARAEGAESVKRWKDVYKPAAVTSPINGDVIVRDIEPGQTVNASTAVVVLSDRLIVEARVDETDIGRVKVGQPVTVKLDAYPDVVTSGKVDHISYESKVVNNVTMYEVEIAVDRIPEVFRSGMNAEVTITWQSKKDIIVLPQEAVTMDKDGEFVMLVTPEKKDGVRTAVVTGLGNNRDVEIVEGLKPGDRITVKKTSFTLKGPSEEKNPFAFGGRNSHGKKKGSKAKKK